MLRPAVIGVFVNQKRQILIGERADVPNSWQLPQGGIDLNEAEDEAIIREMSEEVGTHDFEVIAKSPTKTSYLFPKGQTRWEQHFVGQEHTWYLLEFLDDAQPNPTLSDEFICFRWADPMECLDLVIDWKKQSYQKGLQMLGFSV